MINELKFIKVTLTEKITSLTQKMISSNKFKEAARKQNTDFTRKRGMPFEEVIPFMLTSFKCSTQSALRHFFNLLGKFNSIKQQSFSEARQKIKVSAFIELFKLTVDAMVEECHKKWNEYSVYATDGSKIALPSAAALTKHFYSLGIAGSAPTAQGSCLYDVLNDIIIDALMEPLSSDERTLAIKHIENSKDILSKGKNLVIYDRGYASFDFIKKHEDAGLFYLMRVKSKFNKDIDAQTSPNGYIHIEKNDIRLLLRVIKFKLDSGETEMLITNIMDKRFGIKAFKKLYFLRWPVETKYDIVKNKLQVENFTSRTVEGVQQDFYATMYLANVAAAAAYDAQAGIDAARMDKNNKYQYKANINELIGILKDKLVWALTQDDPNMQNKTVGSIINEIERYVTPIRPNRSVPRKKPRKAKFHHNRKINC